MARGTCLIWTYLARLTSGTQSEENESVIFFDPAGGGGFRIGLLLGRVGVHGSQAGNISSRMLCLWEASFLFSCLANTLASIRRAVTTPFSGWPHHSFLLFPLSVITPYVEHPSCHQSPWPMRRNPRLWCVSEVWPSQERRTSRNGRGSRRRQGGETTDASER